MTLLLAVSFALAPAIGRQVRGAAPAEGEPAAEETPTADERIEPIVEDQAPPEEEDGERRVKSEE